ncbi:Protein Star [Orchesella cincta]|uniref:Protein Star n=1 Tax=Orchesella cincta TaxID=48709 RepID=A0A1D2NK60_ORCCI|nr:Protein Star [Orchesella cincta]
MFPFQRAGYFRFVRQSAIILCLLLLVLLLYVKIGNLQSSEVFTTKNCSSSENDSSLVFTPGACLLDVEYVEQNFVTLDQKDPVLISYSRIKYLSPPSKLEYVLAGPVNKPEQFADQYSTWIAKFFQHKKNGLFIECGAHTGENPSHTLHLELQYNWTGLLIECNPTLIPILRKHHRKAWIGAVCLSPKTTPGMHKFYTDFDLKWTQNPQLETSFNKVKNSSTVLAEVYSVPLYTLLASIGLNTIDWFSLDVEGAEFEILETIPWDLVTIKVLTVEEIYLAWRNKIRDLDDHLRKNKMHYVKTLVHDRVYVHESVLHLKDAMDPN